MTEPVCGKSSICCALNIWRGILTSQKQKIDALLRIYTPDSHNNVRGSGDKYFKGSAYMQGQLKVMAETPIVHFPQ